MQRVSVRLRLEILMMVSAGGLLLCGGCDPAASGGTATRPGDALSPEQIARQGTESHIIGVIAYYPSYTHWIWTEERDRVSGLKVGALYLEGPGGKGVFGDGVIRPKLYVRQKQTGDSTQEWQLVKEWSFDALAAFPLRTKKPTVQGDGYMLPLSWNDLNLGGHEIRLVITYERSDGHVVRSRPKYWRVPLKSG
jgi:hypothetical protein